MKTKPKSIPDGHFRVVFKDSKEEKIVPGNQINAFIFTEKQAYTVFNWRGEAAFQQEQKATNQEGCGKSVRLERRHSMQWAGR